MMRRIEAFKGDTKIALLKEDLNGKWRVFVYSNRQTFRHPEGGWTEQQAKDFVTTYIGGEATFKERL